MGLQRVGHDLVPKQKCDSHSYQGPYFWLLEGVYQPEEAYYLIHSGTHMKIAKLQHMRTLLSIYCAHTYQCV